MDDFDRFLEELRSDLEAEPGPEADDIAPHDISPLPDTVPEDRAPNAPAPHRGPRGVLIVLAVVAVLLAALVILLPRLFPADTPAPEATAAPLPTAEPVVETPAPTATPEPEPTATPRPSLEVVKGLLQTVLADEAGTTHAVVEGDEASLTVTEWFDELTRESVEALLSDEETASAWEDTVAAQLVQEAALRAVLEETDYGDTELRFNTVSADNREDVLLTISDGLILFDAARGDSSPRDADADAAADAGASLDEVTVEIEDSVPNDVTGHWKIAYTSTGLDAVANAIEYYNTYFSGDTDIHFIIDTVSNTTTRIAYGLDMLFVDVYEHVDGEENDASTLPSGTKLGSYVVDTFTGEIDRLS